MEQEQRKKHENIVAGIVGAFLGTLVGALCTVVIGQLGYVASISGLIMAVGALKGYELLGGTLSKKGAAISSVLILVMTYLAHRLTWAISIASALNVGIFDCFQIIPDLLDTGALEARSYWADLAMLYLFTLVGAVPTIIGGLRNADMPDLPPASAAPAAQAAETADAAFYPGLPAWIRPLRLSTALSMFMGLVPAFLLIFFTTTAGNTFTPLFAAIGCLASAFVMMAFALPAIQLFNGAMYLMVRVNGTVWKVTLHMLNNQDTYRFTKKLGALKGLRWEILTPEEQDRAKASVLRAISLLTSGQVMPGSLLSMAVCPLTDLQVIKEDRWQWKCTYSIHNGRHKKIAIPKAYPDFAPVPGLEPAREPVPARWGLLGAAAALAVVLGLAGAGIGYQMDNPIRPANPNHTPSSAPTHTVQPTQPSIEDVDYRSLFHVGTELGYSYTAVGYIIPPDGMADGPGYVADAHVPYSENPEYLDDGHTIRSSAHGMEVTVTILPSDGNAQDVVDQQAYDAIHALDDTTYNASETQYFDDYDTAVKQVVYTVENGTKARVALFYADYKQDGYYLSAVIIYQPELMDEAYPQLLSELSDAYALNLPEIPPIDQIV